MISDMAAMKLPHALIELECSTSLEPIRLPPDAAGGHVLVRWRDRPVGRFWISRSRHGPVVEGAALERLVDAAAGPAILTEVTRSALRRTVDDPVEPLSLTIAVCTRGRPHLLRRCLIALREARARCAEAERITILVVDNAPPDDGTRRVAEELGDVRYAVEPVPGLDCGRNRALEEADSTWLAFVDDDAVIDRGWLPALSAAAARMPDAGCFTGPILPLTLETEAQRRFERAGGFGKGFWWRRHAGERWGDPIYPASAGSLGTGANMVFAVKALRDIGGFDEALDTGPPLPGGGDLDAFYRIVRAGWPLVYEPALLMHHEHRADMPGLRRQYHSWGLSIHALADKHIRQDPDMATRHRRVIGWWTRNHLRRLARALLGRGVIPPSFVAAEILGGVQGAFGEYARSRRRMAERRRRFSS